MTLDDRAPGSAVPPPPRAVHDLAEACVAFVAKSVGVPLDYEAETLPLLDHYLAEARASAEARPEARALVAHAAGAYFGEVLRRRHGGAWRLEGEDPRYWEVELDAAYLVCSPVQLMADALELRHVGGLDDIAGLELAEDDREVVAARLGELPEVSEEEYVAPTTRLEVIDIAVDAIRARRFAEAAEAEAEAEPEPPKPRRGENDYGPS